MFLCYDEAVFANVGVALVAVLNATRVRGYSSPSFIPSSVCFKKAKTN